MPGAKPLSQYVTAVAAVWGAILVGVWLMGDAERLRTFAHVCGGFFIGMLAMYIAVHFYQWR